MENCKSEEQRQKHVSETFVRWSEIHRLPNFNPVRFLIVDPMHCLFLGIAHWIVKRLWIDGGKITKSDLELMEKRAKEIRVPADLGQIPYKIAGIIRRDAYYGDRRALSAAVGLLAAREGITESPGPLSTAVC